MENTYYMFQRDNWTYGYNLLMLEVKREVQSFFGLCDEHLEECSYHITVNNTSEGTSVHVHVTFPDYDDDDDDDDGDIDLDDPNTPFDNTDVMAALSLEMSQL